MILISKVMVIITFKVNIKKSYDEYEIKIYRRFFGKELFKNLPIMNFSVSGIDYNNNETKKLNVIFSTFVNFEFFSISI